jgi:lia operon protein LiaI
MKKSLLFVAGLIAAMILLANMGPIVLLVVSIWLLYLIFKQFMKAETTASKILWVIVGLAVLSMGISNLYAVFGIAAAIVLYLVIKNWKSTDKPLNEGNHNDPFTNFEHQWGELNK